jgi:hypothetical protein
MPLEMDYHSLFKDYSKTFYFDCDPPLRKNELAEDHEATGRTSGPEEVGVGSLGSPPIDGAVA